MAAPANARENILPFFDNFLVAVFENVSHVLPKHHRGADLNLAGLKEHLFYYGPIFQLDLN